MYFAKCSSRSAQSMKTNLVFNFNRDVDQYKEAKWENCVEQVRTFLQNCCNKSPNICIQSREQAELWFWWRLWCWTSPPKTRATQQCHQHDLHNLLFGRSSFYTWKYFGVNYQVCFRTPKHLWYCKKSNGKYLWAVLCFYCFILFNIL